LETTYLTLGLAVIVLGYILLAAELFIPSGGVLLVLSGGGIIFGIILTFAYSSTAGWITLIAVFVLSPIVIGALLHFWPKTPLGKRFFLTVAPDDATVAALPANQELEHLKGRIGKTLSALRPAGVVDFDGRRVDTLTEGMMVGPGQLVRCIDVRAGRVIVRPVEKPNLGELETASFD
jgi:membrane-bound serine protease (ClpP class)